MELIQFEHTVTKQDAKAKGFEWIRQMLDLGEQDPIQVMSNLARFKEFINEADKELRKHIILPEPNYKYNGVEFSMRNTGDRYDYTKDPIYADIALKLKIRKDLLDLRIKSGQQIFDEEGVEVPLVPCKITGGEVLNVKF